ncbi:hypothetical protein SAMN04489724_2630 [Algoriphagus locisalis]|uniref:Tryptophan-rich sensory protein n=1 Tax=Algoriphagus locisalis TaxID=305507 RepID=A0A1I7BR87_9BACT|nr:hypothetical protein [Algoriphagus locisalis]SFT89680.1 hypothetical protein SAMN04489724_2630 [Algoriphagus locisalis]
MSRIEQYIAKIKRQLTIQAGVKALLAGLALAAFGLVFTSSVLALSLVAPLGFLVFAYFLGLFETKRTQAIKLLHERFPELEFSLELLSNPSKNIAEQLQWERVNASFQGGEIQLWHKNTWPFMAALLLAGGVYGLSLLSLPGEESPVNLSSLQDEMKMISVAERTVEMTSSEISITPPSYSGLQKVVQSTLDLRALIGSDIEWVISLSNSDDLTVELINSNGDGLEFSKQGTQFVLRDRVKGSGIYAIRASRNNELVYESDYHPLEAVLDLAPVIQPEGKELYTYHFTQDPKIINVKAKVSDDFKVREVFLVATLARGSGENVKFRENRIPISSRNFKSKDLSVTLDLNALDFRHGDELYYYWAAVDNKTPEPNFSRSDTYFINYVDSAGMTEEELIGMAIHVMPDYFRSQRQIIIDTQKLLEDKNNLTDREFNVKSNEIGYDQKMLRLRYGQYLGEEFEETAGGAQVEGDSEDLLEGYMHKHDEEHEAGVTANVLLPAQTQETHVEEEHHSSEDDSGLGGLLDSYLHNHDDAETNTYFEESTKSTLKLALEQMWQSELYMRLFEPDQALPYQEKALEYLKTVQQKSRVYVKRTGFDPPPIKVEEKRLTGDLEDLQTQIELEQIALENRLAPLAAQVLGLLPKQQLSAVDKAAVQKLGELWTARMNYSGLDDWSLLLQLQELNSGEIKDEGKKELFQKLYPLTAQSEGANASFLKQKELEKAFWSKLQ